MGLEATTKNYWIAPNAFQITLNALGDANRIQGSVASGSVVSCYIEEVKPASAGPDYAGNGDGLQLDNGRNPKRWTLSLSPTYFNSDTAKYVYVAIPRSVAIGTQAVIVFPSERLDLYGKNSSGTQVGSTDFFYVFLQGIISTPEGDPLQRKWTRVIEYGSLGTYQDIVDLSDSDWYSYSKITDIVTFLKEIIMSPLSSFRNLRLNGKELTDVATAATGEEYVDSETMVVTPSYLKTHLSNKYIRKDKDDETPFSLVVGGILTALNSIINNIRSSNYTGDGVADTGWSVTNNFNGTGMSGLVVDYIYARVKLVAEALEVKKYEVSAGDQIFSSAANYINRTEYLDSSDNPIGYSKVKVPWLLNKMPFLLRHLPNALGIFATTKVIRSTMTTSQLQQIAKIRCYFLAKDDDRDVENWWRVGDLARCQSMNLSSSRRNDYTGVERKAGNVMWWRKVIGVSTNPTRTAREDGNDFTNGTYSDEDSGPVTLDDGKEYHYFDVAYNYDAENATPYQYPDALYLSDIPCAGDAAVQFGNDRDPNRMNLLTLELNGLMNADAPCVKIYRGIYTFDLNRCWWGGKPRKMILSPSTGFEFYGPSFKFVEEHGIARVPRDRGTWTDISLERDDYEENGVHRNVRRCYYYDRVTHNGSLWLCVASSLDNGDGAHWVRPQKFSDESGYNPTLHKLFDDNGDYKFNGNYISDTNYNNLSNARKTECGRVQNYIVSEPADNSTDWEKQVAKGDDGTPGAFKSRVFLRKNTTPSTPSSAKTPVPEQPGKYYNSYDYPIPPPTVLMSDMEVWTDGIPQGSAVLWSTVCTFYADGTNSGWSTPAPETDTADLDIEFSPSTTQPAAPTGNTPHADHRSEGWYDPSQLPAGQTMIWRAERKIKNGVFDGDWVVTRIYGEKGEAAADIFTLDITPQSIINSSTFVSQSIIWSMKKHVAGGTIENITHGQGGYYLAYYYGSAWHAPSQSGISITKAIADANSSIPFEMRKVKSGQTYSIDNPSTYDVLDAKTLQVLNEGEDGRPGADGDDALNVIISPDSLIINQNMTGGDNLAPSATNNLGEISIQVRKGATACLIKSITATATNLRISESALSGNYTSRTWNPSAYSASLFIKGIGSPAQGSYYDNGQIAFVITYTDVHADEDKTVQGFVAKVYVNLLGSWKTTVEAGVQTELGELKTYVDEQDGVLQQDYEGKIEKSAKEMRSEYTEQISRAGDYNRNLFGFSRGIILGSSSGEAPIQFIQGYGVLFRGVQDSKRGGRISNLKLKSTGGPFVVTCQMKLTSGSGNVQCELCNVVGVTPNDKQYETVGTTWKSCTFYFFIPEDNIYIDTNGGFLDFQGDWTTSGKNIYVRHLKIERGTKATDFCEADEDIAYLGQGQMITSLSVGSTNVTVSEGQWTIDGSTKRGYEGTAYLSTLASDGYVNVLWQSDAFTLKKGRCYTLSFYAQSVDLATITSYLYKSSADIITNVGDEIYTPTDYGLIEGVTSDGMTHIKLNSTWHQYFIRFYINSSASELTQCSVIALRMLKARNSGSSYRFMIADIHLQEGYVIGETYFRSLIEQNARRISLVQQTGSRLAGIDIENGIVNLKGDRVIFSNGDGSVSGKVTIDPETGTLNAVDGNFSGTVTVDRFISISKNVVRSDYNAWNASPNLSTFKVMPLSATGDMTSFSSDFDLGARDDYISLLNLEQNAEAGQEFTFISYTNNTIQLRSESGTIIAYSGSEGATFNGSLIKLKKGFPVRFLWTGSSWCIIWGYFET